MITGPGSPVGAQLRGIVKRFGTITACDGACFAAEAGRVSALVGENGAGKTTLMRILAGRLAADAGEIIINGRVVGMDSPREAASYGIGMVEQGAPVVGGLTVLENIILGAEPSVCGLINRRGARRRAREVMERAGLALDPGAPAEALSAPQRQRAAILRALYRGAGVLILDEPTALLGPAERRALFETMRSLASAGAAVVFISHKLGEVFEVADAVTVMRRGRTVLQSLARDTDADEVARAMVGGEFRERAAGRGSAGEEILVLCDVCTSGGSRDALKGVKVRLRRGEITGIAGVAGNGQRALADVVAGLVEPAGGVVKRSSGCRRTSLIGEDVDDMDLVGPMRVWENAVFGREGRFARFGRFCRAAARERAVRLGEDYRISGALDGPAAALSGGNRQRLAVGRELCEPADLVVAEEPTRGLDIAGADLVRGRLRAAADAGAAVLLFSYDLDELYAAADRILVISAGRIVEPSAQPPARDELGRLMGA